MKSVYKSISFILILVFSFSSFNVIDLHATEFTDSINAMSS